jgi:hypothetical protein
MKNISRYSLILITILSLMVILPWLFWLTFEKPIRAPFVMYSCVDDCFMIRGVENGIQYSRNEHGKEYTRDEFEQKLPLLNIRQLIMSNTMPDSIKGVAMEPHAVNMARSFYRYKPETMKAPKPGLYPLFESESGRAQLEMPLDFFRITSRMEFVDAAGNKINEEKSDLFTGALKYYGFNFPAKMIEGIPTTRKSCDEGYFVIDNSDQMFHIKMEEGMPYVYKVENPEGLLFKYIACVDFKNKLFYCYLVGKDNSLFILTQDDYDIVRLPVEGFNADNQELRIYGDLFNYNVIMQGEDHLKVAVLDAQFNKVVEYEKSWENRATRPEGIAFSYVFPAQLNLTDSNSSFIDFYFNFTKNFKWIFFSIILVLIHFLIVRTRNEKPKYHLFDFGIILISGIFGFIAINIFPHKHFE